MAFFCSVSGSNPKARAVERMKSVGHSRRRLTLARFLEEGASSSLSLLVVVKLLTASMVRIMAFEDAGVLKSV
jgi:hypothetical protein